ncbi:MAG: AraC family transcriptional regulator [Gemmatimonadota bacterium]
MARRSHLKVAELIPEELNEEADFVFSSHFHVGQIRGARSRACVSRAGTSRGSTCEEFRYPMPGRRHSLSPDVAEIGGIAASSGEGSAAVNQPVGIGRFVAWDGGCLFIGEHHIAVPPHAHHAIQLVLGRGAPHLVRAGERAPWVEYSAALIPSRQPHSIDVTKADYGIVVFVEPETREGRAITERYLQSGVAEVGSNPLETAARHLFEIWLRQETEQAIATAARSLVRVLSEGIEPTVVTDDRIVRAVSYIGANLAHPLTLDELASHVFLSPSRFRHLFAEQTGMGLRPYVLWRRFLHVWDLVMRGVSLSTAAHSAGFADAAHLTRTSKRMFGFAPSAMHLVASPPATAEDEADSGISVRNPPRGVGSRTRTGRRDTRRS